MKVVINTCYGGFSLPDEICKKLSINQNLFYESEKSIRTNKELIRMIEEDPEEFSKMVCTELAVVDIPDEATDWEITDYDGQETVIAVVDGKIIFI